jgi:hypothetical protein
MGEDAYRFSTHGLVQVKFRNDKLVTIYPEKNYGDQLFLCGLLLCN